MMELNVDGVDELRNGFSFRRIENDSTHILFEFGTDTIR